MHAIYFGNPETLHHAVFNHSATTPAAFFSRLENHNGSAGKVAGFRQIFGCTQQHRRMSVMTAGMHFTGRFGRIGLVGGFMDGQGIHIGPHADDLVAGLAATDDAHDTRAANSRDHLVTAETFQLLCHNPRRAMHIVIQFGMGMEIAPPFSNFL